MFWMIISELKLFVELKLSNIVLWNFIIYLWNIGLSIIKYKIETIMYVLLKTQSLVYIKNSKCTVSLNGIPPEVVDCLAPWCWWLWDTAKSNGALSDKIFFSKSFLSLNNCPGCIGQWISQHGVRCGWSRLPAKFPWCRQLTPASPAPQVKTWWTQAMDHLSCSNIWMGRKWKETT